MCEEIVFRNIACAIKNRAKLILLCIFIKTKITITHYHKLVNFFTRIN